MVKRTKNQIRGSKSKGSQFEMSVRDSLLQIYPDTLLTKQEGFVKQYDITVPSRNIVIECKRHKGFSWNELRGYYAKLRLRAQKGDTCYLIFQANRQPCLVMFWIAGTWIGVMTFEAVFRVPFIKHTGVKK